MEKSLSDYQLDLESKDCQWCRKTHSNEGVLLRGLKVEYYPHDGGYKIKGIEGRQWLFVTCPKCQYQWSFKKLGINES